MTIHERVAIRVYPHLWNKDHKIWKDIGCKYNSKIADAHRKDALNNAQEACNEIADWLDGKADALRVKNSVVGHIENLLYRRLSNQLRKP